MGLPLENCMIERTMPKGYIWAKFVQCWTGDPGSAKFFEEKVNPATGETMPAAYFTQIITYDRDSGWLERDIKLQGSDAVWGVLELQEKGQIALLSCEGHVATRSFEGYDGRPVVRSTVHIKQGTIRLHGLQESASSPSLPEVPPPAFEASCGASELQEGPSAGPSEDALSGDGPDLSDGSPF